MRIVKGKVVGNTVILEEALPEGAEVGVVAEDGEATNWNLTAEERAQLREAQDSIDRGESVTDEELERQLAAIDAESLRATALLEASSGRYPRGSASVQDVRSATPGVLS